jgi:hypothetical protein
MKAHMVPIAPTVRNPTPKLKKPSSQIKAKEANIALQKPIMVTVTN